MTKKAIVVTPEGSVEEIDFSEDSLTVLQTAVGGWVQAVEMFPTLTLWVNEEGKLNNLPYNIYASKMWEQRFGVGTDIIVGNAVFTGGGDEEGDTLGLSDEQVELLKRFVKG